MATKRDRGKRATGAGRAKKADRPVKDLPSDRELLDRLRTELAVLDRRVHDMKLYTQLRKWYELVQTFGEIDPLLRRVRDAMDEAIGRFEKDEYMSAAAVERITQSMDAIEGGERRRGSP